MNNILNEMEKQINIDKEVIDVLPKKGIKARRKFIEQTEEMIEQYEKIKNDIKKEIEDRYQKITNVNQNSQIEELEKEILKLDNLSFINENQSSFEKMGLDKLIYNINGFYKKNLEIINNDIIECIKRFKQVGIELTSENFNISEYTKEYMAVLIEEDKKGNKNSEKVKNTFEKIYWKCSDIISYININLRHIYDENEKEIDKFYKKTSEEIQEKLNITQEEIEIKKDQLIRKMNELKDIDKKIILNNFLEGKLKINDYQKENYNKIYEKLIPEKIDTFSEKEKIEMDENIRKLHSNLNEYNKYLKFKFINDDILQLRKEKIKEIEKNEEEKKKESKKPESENIRNDLKKVKTQIIKLNTEINKGNKLGFITKKHEDKKIETKISERNNKILEIKELYTKLDNSLLKEKIVSDIDNTSKILDVLKFASYYHGFLARSIIKKYPEIIEEDINKMIDEFIKFVRLNEFSVINNIEIENKKEISIIIKDKYKLFGMDLSKENFSTDNIELLTKDTEIINNYNNIEKSGISIEEIQFIIEAKEILKK